MGAEGELKIIEAPKADTTAIVIQEENANTGLIVASKEDYENVSEEKNEYVADLVVCTFCPLPVATVIELDYLKEVEKYNNYLTFYQQIKSDFIKIAKPLIEKILGVTIGGQTCKKFEAGLGAAVGYGGSIGIFIDW